ncbi:hypothetical protein D3C72_2139340 [compost metagenome]
MSSRINFHMRRQFGLLNLGGNRRHNDRRAESVANIVLYDQYGPYSALFRTYYRRKVGKKNVAAFNDQYLHPAY